MTTRAYPPPPVIPPPTAEQLSTMRAALAQIGECQRALTERLKAALPVQPAQVTRSSPLG
jgi:hypothetical protein